MIRQIVRQFLAVHLWLAAKVHVLEVAAAPLSSLTCRVRSAASHCIEILLHFMSIFPVVKSCPILSFSHL